MKYKANCCTNLSEVVEWFRDLKEQGVKEDEVLDILDFDENQYPDVDILRKARAVVFHGVAS